MRIVVGNCNECPFAGTMDCELERFWVRGDEWTIADNLGKGTVPDWCPLSRGPVRIVMRESTCQLDARSSGD